MAMMVGVGPFITIPLFLATMGGPQAMVGWVLGALVAVADGLVWAELAAAFPGSGGTFHFYDAVYGRRTLGRLLKFLFVWQFLFGAPLELASGAIGLGQYAGYWFGWLKGAAWTVSAEVPGWGPATWVVARGQLFAASAMLAITGLAYRRVEVAGRLMVVMWAGMLLTVGWVIVAGLTHFDPKMAFDFPPNAFRLDGKFGMGLGAALGIAMYDYFGYYQICYMGDEVADPARTLPRAVLISAIAVAMIYLSMNVGILGVVPWREVIASPHIASDFMARRYLGPWPARIITLMILWTGAASMFAGVLGYARVPYAAARSGHFFGGLGVVDCRQGIPGRSLMLVGGLSSLGCLFDLPTVINALLASRIVVQFVGQIATIVYIRKRPELSSRLRFRMPFYPLPALVALAGWLYVGATLEKRFLIYGAGSIVAGVLAFGIWDRRPGWTPTP